MFPKLVRLAIDPPAGGRERGRGGGSGLRTYDLNQSTFGGGTPRKIMKSFKAFSRQDRFTQSGDRLRSETGEEEKTRKFNHSHGLQGKISFFRGAPGHDNMCENFCEIKPRQHNREILQGFLKRLLHTLPKLGEENKRENFSKILRDFRRIS